MQQINLTATATIVAGNAHNENVSRHVFQVLGATWTGSIVVKARVTGSALTSANWKTVPYTNRATGVVVAAGTAITTDGLFEVDAAGVDIIFDYTHTGGSAIIYDNPIQG